MASNDLFTYARDVTKRWSKLISGICRIEIFNRLNMLIRTAIVFNANLRGCK
jgi:hypothetical protein